MKLAYSTPTADDAQRRVLFDNFRRIGYDGVQLKWSQYADYLDAPGRLGEVWGDREGMASAVITGGRLDAAGCDGLRQVFTFGEALGADLVIYCHGESRDGMTDDDLRRFAGQFSAMGREAIDRGMKLTVHNHYDSPVMLRRDVEAFYGAAEDGTVGLTVDTAHFAKSGVEDIAGLIRQFSGVIDNFHLKDFADGEWRVLGRGAIDFGPIFQAIKDISYNGWVSTDEESGGDILEAMQTCFDFVTRALK